MSSKHNKPDNAYLLKSILQSDIDCDNNSNVNDFSKDNKNEIANENIHRSFCNRLFGKMNEGSLRGGILAMSSLSLGTGCLALPRIFENVSLLVAILIIIFGSLSAYWSLTLMIKSALPSKTYDYSKLVKIELGLKTSKFLDVVILIYIFGVLISYQVISK